MYAKGVGPILASTSCKYVRPVIFPDKIVASSKLVKVPEPGETMFVQEYFLWSCEQEQVVAKGEGAIVLYDYARNKKGEVCGELHNALRKVHESGWKFS